jgi:predicted amidohydrolase YtcJ
MPAESRLYFGGEIHSVDAAAPHPEAVAIDQGRILAVGSERACRSALEMGGGYREVDLRGRALLPGFIDTHLHPIMMLYFEMNADLAGVESIGQLQQRLREAARGRSPGDWVVGLRFEDQELDAPRLPSRHDLDRACPERPALVVKHDGHMVIARAFTPALPTRRAGPSTGRRAGTRRGSSARRRRRWLSRPFPLRPSRRCAPARAAASGAWPALVSPRRAQSFRPTRRAPPAHPERWSRSPCSFCWTRCRSGSTAS